MKRKIYREDIINAGRDLMFSKGYSGTGIKDITDKIDIPKGSFYNHFTSKEEFGLEMLKAYSDNGVEIHKQNMLQGEGSPLERLERFYATAIEKYSNLFEFKLGCMMSNFSAEMADINEEFRAVLQHGFEQQESVIETCLNQAKELGEIDQHVDTRLYANQIINGWHGALVRMKAEGNAESLLNWKKFIFGLLKR